MNEPQLVPQIIDAIIPKAQQLADAVLGNNTTQQIPDQIAFLQKEAEEAKNKYDLYQLPEHRNIHKQFLARIAQIEATRAKATEQAERNLKLLTALSTRDYWLSLSPIDLHMFLREIVKDCWIQDGHVVDVTLDLH